MLALVLRKIISNTWKVLCLLLGSILVVGMVCSIPIYTNGILQRLLTKDLESVQASNMRYPGYLVFSSNYNYVNNTSANAASSASSRAEAVPSRRKPPWVRITLPPPRTSAWSYTRRV